MNIIQTNRMQGKGFLINTYKALDIIINKCVNFTYFHNNQTVEYYNKHVADWRQLTPEEFELLNEIYKIVVKDKSNIHLNKEKR